MRSVIRALIFSIIFIGIACGIAAAKDDALRLYAGVNKKTIFIGDRIRYRIEASFREGIEIQAPKFKDELIGDFEIKNSGTEKRSGIFGDKHLIYWYEITIYSVGKQVIPQVEVKYRKTGAKDWISLKTLAININVQSIIPKVSPASDIRDVKGPYGFFEINWWIVSGVIIIFFIVAFFIYKKLSRPVPERLPHETALEELEAAKNFFLKGGDIKEYYVAISDCVRRYIERAFRMKAPEMTTEEFLNLLKDTGQLNAGQKLSLKEFLKACDLVKFAKYAPMRAEMEFVYDKALKFIEETKELSLLMEKTS